MKLNNSEKIQILGIFIALMISLVGSIWYLGGCISRLEERIVSMDTTMDTGFRHTDRAMDKVNMKVDKITQHCCSELYAAINRETENED